MPTGTIVRLKPCGAFRREATAVRTHSQTAPAVNPPVTAGASSFPRPSSRSALPVGFPVTRPRPGGCSSADPRRGQHPADPGGGRRGPGRAEELPQVRGEAFRMGEEQAVTAVLVHLQDGVLHQPGQPLTRMGQGRGGVMGAVHHEHGYVHGGQLGGEIEAGHDRPHGGGGAGRGHQAAVDQIAHVGVGDLVSRAGDGEERVREMGEPGGPVAPEELLVGPYDRRIQAVGQPLRADDARADPAHQRGPGHPGRAVPGQAAHQLGGADGVRDQGGLAQVEVVEEPLEIVGQGVEVVPRPDVVRAPVTAPVQAQAAVSGLGERQHLVLPHLMAEIGAGDEDGDGTAGGTVVDVVQPGAVDGALVVRHGGPPRGAAREHRRAYGGSGPPMIPMVPKTDRPVDYPARQARVSESPVRVCGRTARVPGRSSRTPRRSQAPRREADPSPKDGRSRW
ncbi:hypothetical protein GPN2_20554 [Streptomyces murinus]